MAVESRAVAHQPRSLGGGRRIPEATVARLPLYYRVLRDLDEQGQTTISSDQLAERSGVNAAKVRKDLSYIGTYGTRGVGYTVDELLHEIGRELGLTRDWPVVVIGAGNLGQALVGYGGFGARGFSIVAILDADATKVGTPVGGLAVEPVGELRRIVAERRVAIGVIATPGEAAQAVADDLVAAGVGAVLNFAPTVVNVPETVSLRKVDLATELQILSFYQLRKPESCEEPQP